MFSLFVGLIEVVCIRISEKISADQLRIGNVPDKLRYCGGPATFRPKTVIGRLRFNTLHLNGF